MFIIIINIYKIFIFFETITLFFFSFFWKKKKTNSLILNLNKIRYHIYIFKFKIIINYRKKIHIYFIYSLTIFLVKISNFFIWETWKNTKNNHEYILKFVINSLIINFLSLNSPNFFFLKTLQSEYAYYSY